MRNPCRRHRPADVLPSFVFCPEDALDVLWAVEAEHPDATHVVLVLDRDRRGELALPVSRDDSEAPPTIEDVTDVVIDALGGHPDGPMAVVLGSCRPGQGDALPADVATWDRLQERYREADLELLDWFLLDARLTTSMAEAHGAGWPEPPPV